MSAGRLEAYLRRELGAEVVKSSRLRGAGGCISQGSVFEVDGRKVFIKMNSGAIVS